MSALEVDDLTVEYGTGDYIVRPIEHFSLRVESGSLVILLGPSGSGKTTLLSCLGGILSPSAGTIRFANTEITALSGNALSAYRRRRVGIAFQAFNLVPSLSALNNVMLPVRAGGFGRRQARARARALLEQMGLGHRLRHKPGDLSGGQQQRVAIARALALDPPLLLADEPTAHLDFIQVEEIVRLMRQLASGDRVVVVATHDQRMLPLADRIVELVPDFANLSREPEHRGLADGEIVFRQGDRSELIYVVEDGEIEILRESLDGSRELIRTVPKGRYFGEIGPMIGVPRSATARALGSTRVTGYTVRDFRGHIGAQDLATLVAHDHNPWQDTVSEQDKSSPE